jgi:glycine betaine/proline transport system substrate-binding protein
MAGMVITGTSFAACGSLTMAEMNWASAQLMAQVDKVILEKGYGCEVELVSGATMPTFASMNEKGKPDVAAEQWANAVRDPLAKAVSEGRLHIANESPITGLGEGWWIPPATAKKISAIENCFGHYEASRSFPG